LLGLAAVVAVALVLIARPKPSGLPAEMQSTHVQQGAAAENSQSAQASTQQEPKLSPAAPGNAKVRGAKVEGATPEAGGDEKASTNTDTTNNDNQGGVVRQVMPQVLPGARRTIQGKIKVGVKVKVDAAGDVSQATLESPGPSRYFSRVALEAAWGWKFSPAQSGEQPIVREWKLQFAFSRARTEVSAVRTKR